MFDEMRTIVSGVLAALAMTIVLWLRRTNEKPDKITDDEFMEYLGRTTTKTTAWAVKWEWDNYHYHHIPHDHHSKAACPENPEAVIKDVRIDPSEHGDGSRWEEIT